RRCRQLARLADGHKARPQLVRQRRSENKPARLDARHQGNLLVGIVGRQRIHQLGKRLRLLQQRGDVVKKNPLLGEVRHFANVLLQAIAQTGGGGRHEVVLSTRQCEIQMPKALRHYGAPRARLLPSAGPASAPFPAARWPLSLPWPALPLIHLRGFVPSRAVVAAALPSAQRPESRLLGLCHRHQTVPLRPHTNCRADRKGIGRIIATEVWAQMGAVKQSLKKARSLKPSRIRQDAERRFRLQLLSGHEAEREALSRLFVPDGLSGPERERAVAHFHASDDPPAEVRVCGPSAPVADAVVVHPDDPEPGLRALLSAHPRYRLALGRTYPVLRELLAMDLIRSVAVRNASLAAISALPEV